MTWWSFDRAAKERVDEEVEASGKLREERRLARAAARGRYRIHPLLVRICVLCVALLLVLTAASHSVEHLVAVTMLWTLGEMFLRGAQFRAALYDDPGLIVYDFLPIADDEIFRAQWKRFLLGTGWCFFGFAMAYGMLLMHSGMRWNALPGGLALGAAQWLFTMASAVCLVAFAPPKRVAALALPILTAAFLLIWFGTNLPRLCQWLSGLAWLVPPLSWILQSLGASDNNGIFHRVLPPLMSAAVLALAPFAFRRLRQVFLSSEPKHSTDGRTREVIELGEHLAQNPDETRAATEAREFLTGFDWQTAGVLERLFVRSLTARERTIAEFMLAGIPTWTKIFGRSLLILLVVAVLLWPLRNKVSSELAPIFAFGLLAGAVNLAGSMRGFSLPCGSALPSPFFAIYPIGFWELTRVVLKSNLIRCLLCLPYFVVFFGFTSGIMAPSIGIVLKALVLLLIMQPISVIFAISPNTNDTGKASLACIALMLIPIMLGACITFFLVTTWWIVVLAGLIMVAVSVGMLLLYARWFNRSRFDLVPIKRSDIQVRA